LNSQAKAAAGALSRQRLLELALHNEIRGHNFYTQVAESSLSAEVQCIAKEMAVEEGGHVAMLREWLAKEADKLQPPLADLDPPNMPE
jgi:rubrerythrin